MRWKLVLRAAVVELAGCYDFSLLSFLLGLLAGQAAGIVPSQQPLNDSNLQGSYDATVQRPRSARHMRSSAGSSEARGSGPDRREGSACSSGEDTSADVVTTVKRDSSVGLVGAS